MYDDDDDCNIWAIQYQYLLQQEQCKAFNWHRQSGCTLRLMHRKGKSIKKKSDLWSKDIHTATHTHIYERKLEKLIKNSIGQYVACRVVRPPILNFNIYCRHECVCVCVSVCLCKRKNCPNECIKNGSLVFILIVVNHTHRQVYIWYCNQIILQQQEYLFVLFLVSDPI